ncbi:MULTISPECIES: type II toxin-antitoxin system RelE/ParE family toxin [Flavobacterium]|uniref:Type II toxin-antitoxin system RelE/ParE family toxin n=1 Tax=Flavobacterium gawalongense TaxID=2594432 RepID=A0A553BKB2_9FLAO|nr:type II toxin-antitoxin system RelE/ParE family toxin [Flavobacterium gawalongense]TRX03986.1 type II toxin-antitoxin system RelE/ParE family toxin [Flavobacterium gawalongense]TRX07164.1 type II toxin-antitoxin system RelE/ParE family toxin [Flavobacterium gawalongense]TRX08695.1 type II toxin-antitoxin system RelE/ParE family toxin [Flavobacterium gawalongense]TRX09468.1 type II toxin-antitoxin system RelE/ParE family toxin [Flavobacterium gawalongense]TRX25439.1 type II toxin-antitoxin s
MVIKTVVWTDTAVRQRRKILSYWTKRNKSSTYSKKLIYEILERVQFLIKNPEIYITTNLIDIRTSTLGHYNIFYKTTKKDLIVVAFWDNRQNPKKLLQLLKKS